MLLPLYPYSQAPFDIEMLWAAEERNTFPWWFLVPKHCFNMSILPFLGEKLWKVVHCSSPSKHCLGGTCSTSGKSCGIKAHWYASESLIHNGVCIYYEWYKWRWLMTRSMLFMSINSSLGSQCVFVLYIHFIRNIVVCLIMSFLSDLPIEPLCKQCSDFMCSLWGLLCVWISFIAIFIASQQV